MRSMSALPTTAEAGPTELVLGDCLAWMAARALPQLRVVAQGAALAVAPPFVPDVALAAQHRHR